MPESVSELKARIGVLESALRAIVDYSEEPFDHPPGVWAQHTPETCAQCKYWRDMRHPLQHSCDDWYRLIRLREWKQRDQQCTMHYKLRDIAREALK